MGKKIIIGVFVVTVVVVSLIVVLNNKDTKLDGNDNSVEDSEIIGNVNNSSINDEEVVVNRVVDATDKVELGSNLIAQVIDGSVKVNDKTLEIEGEDVEVVTGYYYQPGAVYCLFAKGVDKNVYVLSFNKDEGISNKEFKKIKLTNIDKLSLYDVTVTDDMVGSVDERNRVYAINEDEKIQIDSYCFE